MDTSQRQRVRTIVRAVMGDSRASAATIAERCGVSPSAAQQWRSVKIPAVDRVWTLLEAAEAPVEQRQEAIAAYVGVEVADLRALFA